MPGSPQRAAIARAARAAKSDPNAQPRLDELRRQYRESQLADYIRGITAASPPLTTDQRCRLASMLLATA